MISSRVPVVRLFYFGGAGVARLVDRLPSDFQREALGGDVTTVQEPAVILVDAAVGQLERALAVRQGGALEIVVLGEVTALPAAPSEHVYAYLVDTLPTALIAQALANAFVHAQLRQEQGRMKDHVEQLTREFQKLNAIGIALTAERDTPTLLRLILQKAREITQADGGSLYLMEEVAGHRQLRFAIVQNDSLAIPFEGKTLQVDNHSLAGYVAATGAVLNMEDAYAPPAGTPFEIDRRYDQETGYRTKSILVVPMKTPDGRMLGVLELINYKANPARRFARHEEIERDARPFPSRFEDLAMSVVSQAAVALETSRLHAELEMALARATSLRRASARPRKELRQRGTQG